MDLESVIYKLRRGLERRIQSLAISVTSGGVDNMETYKYIIGQINALESVKQEISNLLDEKEQREGIIVDIKKPGNSKGVSKGSPKA
jgi:hypothetical protein